MRIKIGTRGSKLALWQAKHVAGVLGSLNVETELCVIRTKGDEVQDVPLRELGTTGIFTKALDEALLDGRIDIAVHSSKDMPSVLAAPLELVAILKREDPRDVLLGNDESIQLENFARPLVIGTSSVRRRALLKHFFPQVEVKEIRGNIDTRIDKMRAGEYDGIMLAYAGVKRLGFQQLVTQKFNLHSFTPAPGQGAIGVSCRADYAQKALIRQALNHTATEVALRCERAFLRGLNAGCQTPAFGLATVFGSQITFVAGLAEENGHKLFRSSREGEAAHAEQIGMEVAGNILKQKAATA
ncbi:MAG: hydroxymethylbilane synthase [Bacteroidota bacterium]